MMENLIGNIFIGIFLLVFASWIVGMILCRSPFLKRHEENTLNRGKRFFDDLCQIIDHNGKVEMYTSTSTHNIINTNLLLKLNYKNRPFVCVFINERLREASAGLLPYSSFPLHVRATFTVTLQSKSAYIDEKNISTWELLKGPKEKKIADKIKLLDFKGYKSLSYGPVIFKDFLKNPNKNDEIIHIFDALTTVAERINFE